tara:strand:- start:80 stop:958 length:879 start_codon:yes stop_codon:yes gene_type:complete
VKILITGANGTIGSDLVEFFSKNHKIFAFYRTSNQFSKKFKNKNISWFKNDLKNPIKNKIKPDIIIHCAVTHPFSKKNKSYLDYINSNIISLKNILEFASKNEIKKFFYLSSVKIYGNINKKILNDENLFLNPDILGATKILSENIISLQKFKYYNIRLPGVLCYNISDDRRPWLNQIIFKLMNNQDINIFNSQSKFNNIIDTKEIYKLIKKIISKKTYKSESFNFSASKPIKIKIIIDHIKKRLSSKSKIYFKMKKTRNFIISSNKVSQNFKFNIENTINIIDRYINYKLK